MSWRDRLYSLFECIWPVSSSIFKHDVVIFFVWLARSGSSRPPTSGRALYESGTSAIEKMLHQNSQGRTKFSERFEKVGDSCAGPPYLPTLRVWDLPKAMKGSHKWADVEERSGQSDVQLSRPQEQNLMNILVGFSLPFANRFKILVAIIETNSMTHVNAQSVAVVIYVLLSLPQYWLWKQWGLFQNTTSWFMLIPAWFMTVHPGNSSCIQWDFFACASRWIFNQSWTGLAVSVTQRCRRTQTLTPPETHSGLHWNGLK